MADMLSSRDNHTGYCCGGCAHGSPEKRRDRRAQRTREKRQWQREADRS